MRLQENTPAKDYNTEDVFGNPISKKRPLNSKMKQ